MDIYNLKCCCCYDYDYYVIWMRMSWFGLGPWTASTMMLVTICPHWFPATSREGGGSPVTSPCFLSTYVRNLSLNLTSMSDFARDGQTRMKCGGNNSKANRLLPLHYSFLPPWWYTPEITAQLQPQHFYCTVPGIHCIDVSMYGHASRSPLRQLTILL